MLRMLGRKSRRSQKGSAFVEGALVFLVSFMSLIFIIDMGRMLLVQQYISERARLTARKAAVNNWSATQVANFLVYDNAYSDSRSTPGRLGLLPSQVSYSSLGTPGTPNHRLKVQVSGVRAFLFIPRLSGNYALPTVIATAPAQSLGATQ